MQMVGSQVHNYKHNWCTSISIVTSYRCHFSAEFMLNISGSCNFPKIIRGSNLSLDSVEPSEPEDLPSPQLSLSMINLLLVLVHLLLGHFILLRQLTSPFEEPQLAVWDCWYNLIQSEDVHETHAWILEQESTQNISELHPQSFRWRTSPVYCLWNTWIIV